MEPVHGAALRPWISQDKIQVSKFIRDCIQSELVDEVSKDSYIAFEDVCHEAALEAGTSVEEAMAAVMLDLHDSALDCDGEGLLLTAQDHRELDNFLEEPSCLESVKLMQRRIREDMKAGRKPHYEGGRQEAKASPVKKDKVPLKASTYTPTAILTIQLFRPMCPNYRPDEQNKKSFPLVVDLEVDFTSNNTLLDIRKFISCASDYQSSETIKATVIGGDSSETDGRKESAKSGFLFIADTFYNDLREPTQIDYSKVIRNWAEGRGIGPFSTGTLHETYLKDITIQLGYPYVYVHQGNCEHIFIFQDIRLMDRHEQEKDFPSVTSINSLRPRVKCGICLNNTASVIVEDEDLPSSQFFFCQDCRDIYYNKKKAPKETPYVDKSALL